MTPEPGIGHNCRPAKSRLLPKPNSLEGEPNRNDRSLKIEFDFEPLYWYGRGVFGFKGLRKEESNKYADSQSVGP